MERELSVAVKSGAGGEGGGGGEITRRRVSVSEWSGCTHSLMGMVSVRLAGTSLSPASFTATTSNWNW